jgi:hypothetical protein
MAFAAWGYGCWPMSNAERIVEFLERFPNGVCDDCISRETGVEPRQQVYQLCQRMEGRTVTRRKGRCALCDRTKTLRAAAARAVSPEGGESPQADRWPGEAVSIEALRNHLDRFCKGLIEKHRVPNVKNGLAAFIAALTDRGILPLHQANMMHTIRSLRNAYVHEHIPMKARETAIAKAAWGIIRELRESELWRRTRDAGGRGT